MSFRTNTPAVAGSFYDRREELERLRSIGRRLVEGDPVWTALLGSRKVGKTSLLLEVARSRSEGEPPWAVIDVFEEVPVSPRFFRRYALRILDVLLGEGLPESLEALSDDPEAFRSALVAAERFGDLPPGLRSELLLLASPKGGSVRSALELPERLAEALDRRLVVAIDEFQELAGLRKGKDPDLLPQMRALWQRHQRVAYVISGSARSMLLELITDRRSPFFQHFDVIDLGLLPVPEALRMLEDGGVPPSLGKMMVEVFGGHPFYLQIVGEELLRAVPPLDHGALKRVIQRVLFSGSGRLGLYLEGEYMRLVGRSSTLAATLLAAAEGPLRVTDIAQRIGATAGSTSRYVRRLRDVVVQDPDGRYLVADAVFGMWLRWRRPGGAAVPMKILGDEGEAVAAERLARMGFDLVYQARGSRGAFDLLATRGAVQLGVQVKRSPLPLRFALDAWHRMNAEGDRFGWLWLIAAVDPADGRVRFLDPERARIGASAILDAGAELTSVIGWLDTPRGRLGPTR